MIRLRPGLMIGLSIPTKGGVSYSVSDVKDEQDGARLVKRWKTVKTIADAEEFERATLARSKARGLIRGVCIPTPFGVLMCPKGQEELRKLAERQAEAETVIAEFNATAVHSKLVLNIVRGEIAATDQEAAAAIRSEIAGLVEEMQAAIKGADVKLMRDAAVRATQLGRLLEERSEARERLTAAVSATRSIARAIIKAGEDTEAVALAIAEERASPVSTARFAFAAVGDDLSDAAQQQAAAVVPRDVQQEAVDLTRSILAPAEQLAEEWGPDDEDDVPPEVLEALRVRRSKALGLLIDDDLADKPEVAAPAPPQAPAGPAAMTPEEFLAIAQSMYRVPTGLDDELLEPDPLAGGAA